MASPSLNPTSSGSGLKAPQGPQGLKLATSPFTSAPDVEAAVVDVYDITKPGVINNGKATQSDDVLERLASSIPGVSGVGDLKSKVGDVTKAVKTAAGMAKNVVAVGKKVMNAASRAVNAVNQIKSGNLTGALTGVSTLTGITGLNSITGAVNTVIPLARGYQYGGALGLVSATSTLGPAFSGVAGLSNTYRTLDNLSRMSFSASSPMAVLGALDRGVTAATSALAGIDKFASTDFTAGYNDAVRRIDGAASAASAKKAVMYDLVDDIHSIGSSVAGAVGFDVQKVAYGSGVVAAGISQGVTDVYSRMSNSGLSDENLYEIGRNAAAMASRSGDFQTFTDVTSTPIGKKAASSDPNAVAIAVTNLDNAPNGYVPAWEKVKSTAQALGQSISTAVVNGVELISSEVVSRSKALTQEVNRVAAAEYRTSQSAMVSNPTKAPALTEAQAIALTASADAWHSNIEKAGYANLYTSADPSNPVTNFLPVPALERKDNAVVFEPYGGYTTVFDSIG